MNEAYIVGSVRTAVGKLGGALKDVEVDVLAEKVIREALARTSPSAKVDEVIMGQAKQSADTSNLARLAALKADLPEEVTGYTVHRQCGSGLQAINNADMQIKMGLSDVVVAGGAESMSTAPYYIRHARFGYRAGNGWLLDPNTESQPCSQPRDQYGDLTMGYTAENLAEQYQVSREDQDEFAHRSQTLATEAIESRRFDDEILPIEIKERKSSFEFKKDEHPRLTSLEKLAKLPAVFKEGGSVTPGNASGRNDGAAAVVMMNEAKVKEYGIKPKAKIIAQAVSGVGPDVMGIGPVSSTEKALKQCNLTIDDIGLIELNEAFAAQALSVIREAKMDLEKVNVNGGAIALGHPIGATGAILVTKLLHEMERRNEKYGLVTLCIGGGQGISTIIEYLD
ncbi:acetyl-CoA C-acyltransferase [Halalkalibacillus sediminis]|uniref:acetyl-CoA C-acetyltransferase n=1 Tax=Halalkalibacillus sediminis TaxID=2018042 RepID=A0A2I0QU68_9BACI|nr:thiolase family protein [Halalkalibacillus sediminis]PKR77893.1 acetyl-CoA C-acyltransferase [Halalkalibacillus sediminis]